MAVLVSKKAARELLAPFKAAQERARAALEHLGTLTWDHPDKPAAERAHDVAQDQERMELYGLVGRLSYYADPEQARADVLASVEREDRAAAALHPSLSSREPKND